MKSIQLIFFFGLALLLSLGWYWYSSTRELIIKGDPYGVMEAEENGGQSQRLIDCSLDPNCPAHADALFWVAADILSESNTTTCEINPDALASTGSSAEDFLYELCADSENYLDAPPEYDISDSEFEGALEMLKKAHAAGSYFASNELGLLYLEQSEMQNLQLAEQYFSNAIEHGDPNSAYNSARLKFIQNPGDSEAVLSCLKLASEGGSFKLEVMYLLGLEHFGSATERENATAALQNIDQNYEHLRREYDAHFGAHNSN
jgi:hypothetical protein